VSQLREAVDLAAVCFTLDLCLPRDRGAAGKRAPASSAAAASASDAARAVVFFSGRFDGGAWRARWPGGRGRCYERRHRSHQHVRARM
jgi:hypothetical protein